MAVDSKKLARRGLAAVLVGIGGYYAIFAGEYSMLDLRRLRVQQEVEAQRLADTRVQVDSLRTLVEGLENDPAMIEAVARERFGMVRDGELLYRFVEIDPSAEAPAGP